MAPHNLRRVAGSVFGRRSNNEYLTPTEQRWALEREVESLNRRCLDWENYARDLESEVEELKSLNSEVVEAYGSARDSRGCLQEDSKRKDDEIQKLQQEIVQYKSTVSSSTLPGKQLSDATIQGKMNALFFAVRDWAVGVVRQGNIAFDIVKPEDNFLLTLVPRLQEGEFTQKVNALIAIFSRILVFFRSRDFVFGKGSDRSYKSATRFYKSFKDMSEAAKLRKKQWVLLTNDILSENPEAAKKAAEETLNNFMENFEKVLSGFSSSVLDPSVVRKLRSVIQPHMATIYSLDHQEADYFFELPSAVNDNKARYVFEADNMEDVNQGQAGPLEASLFPLVFKQNLQDENDYVIVCKAKVMIGNPTCTS